ncbi:MAG: triose-phosphate isomerase [Robiginitomaculum sp.]|nr:MAG: triose-phosphate isomerase [Robiginitomaculum sp.]
MARRKLIAGNWKMNGLQSARKQVQDLITLQGGEMLAKLDVLLCPPATLLADMVRDAGASGLHMGGQDCHAEDHGAHTGDIAASMLKDCGAAYVIVGHSERRADHGESSAEVKAKAEAALAAGLIAIVCVGETLHEREAGQAFSVVGGQVKGSVPDGATAENCVLAYEPVWAIGTGKVATTDDIAAMHGHIRELLDALGGTALVDARVLYGGSVKPGNASDIFALDNVDGGLIGGASLKAADFSAIIDATNGR